jgi:hypothetical protein
MNRSEYVEYELEENVKELERIKLEYETKKKEYDDAVKSFSDSDAEKDIEEKKQDLLTLQEVHRKEVDELKERHKLERENAQWQYTESKNHKVNLFTVVKDALTNINTKRIEAKQKNKELKEEKRRLRKMNVVGVTSHAIVQYLDRAKGMDIVAIKREVNNKRKEEISKKFVQVPDYALVDYLVSEGKLNREEAEKSILTEKIKKLVLRDELLGSTGTYTRFDGFRLVIKNGSVVTFLPKASKPRKRANKFSKRVKRKPRKMKL